MFAEVGYASVFSLKSSTACLVLPVLQELIAEQVERGLRKQDRVRIAFAFVVKHLRRRRRRRRETRPSARSRASACSSASPRCLGSASCCTSVSVVPRDDLLHELRMRTEDLGSVFAVLEAGKGVARIARDARGSTASARVCCRRTGRPPRRQRRSAATSCARGTRARRDRAVPPGAPGT